MDAVARNRSALTQRDYREWLEGTYLKSINSIALSIASLFAFMCVLLFAFDLFFHVANRQTLFAVGVFAMALLVLRFGVPLVSALVAFRRACVEERASSVRELVHEIAFFDDHLETVSGAGAAQTVWYRDIDRIEQTEHLLVVVCGDGRRLLLRKDSFSVGELPEVVALLEANLEG